MAVNDEFVVENFLFYEGNDEMGFDPERIYQVHFDQDQTRYIYWEAHLSYRELAEDKSIIVDVVYCNPDGSVFNEDRIEAILDEGSEVVGFSTGFGYDEVGSWFPGVYSAELFINGMKAAEERFGVYGDESLLDSISVDSLLFYATGDINASPKGTREYKTKFSRFETQYICWEINLTHPPLEKDKNVRFEFIYYTPSGQVLIDAYSDSDIPGGSDKSSHYDGAGNDQPGDWEFGVHRVEIILNGRLIAEKEFEILKDNVNVLPFIQIERLEFFEGGMFSPPKGTRKYSNTFPRETARFINWEAEITFLMVQKRRLLKFSYEFVHESGMSTGLRSDSVILEKGWNSLDLAKGIGDDQPGVWQIGKYTVKLIFDGKTEIQGIFEVI